MDRLPYQIAYYLTELFPKTEGALDFGQAETEAAAITQARSYIREKTRGQAVVMTEYGKIIAVVRFQNGRLLTKRGN